MDIRTSKPCTGVSINSTDTWLRLTIISPKMLYFLPSVWGFFALIFGCLLFLFLFYCFELLHGIIERGKEVLEGYN